MPAVRRTRHGTSGSGQPESSEANSSMYGTRSKRKASDMNGSDIPSSEQKTSPYESQTATPEADDPLAPPAKKSRTSPDTSPRQTIEPVEQSVNGSTQEIPGVVIDPPDSTSPSSEEPPQNHTVNAPPARGGFGRARGRGRGRGRWGGNRGGRGGSGVGARGTPVAESLPPINRPFRGRGGHRVKKSDNARIQALYHRRAALKHQYKHVAQVQKYALLSLAEKSLEAMKSDPTYHKTLPEYEMTIGDLDALYKKRLDQLHQENETRREGLLRRRGMDIEYEHMKCNSAVEEAEEIITAKIKQKVMHVYRQWSSHSTLRKTPLFRDPENKVIKRVSPPETMVHSIATPYTFMLAEHNNPELLEQHPRDHWEAMSDEQKLDWQRRIDGIGGDGKRIKNTRGSALYQPQDAVVDQAVEAPNAVTDAVSAVATPMVEISDGTESEESENAEEQPTDQYGVKVPKKPMPRNGEPPQNRIVCDAPVVFDQDEIGIRKHHVRKTNRNEHQYLGMDPDPNPKKVFYDQVARAYNSARNKKEDLDQEIVRAFKLHPTYGIPLPTSENPDHDQCDNPPFDPPTDWSQPLQPTHPTIFIEEVPELGRRLDEDKKIFFTSRSEWISRTDDEWHELFPKFKMTSALEQMDALEGPPRPPTPEKVKERLRREEKHRAKVEAHRQRRWERAREVIDPWLITAINEAESVRSSESVRSTDSTHIARPSPARSQGYDPVRDTGYQTPYQQTPPPAPAAMASQPERLNALADAAIMGELRGSMPPPSAFRMQLNHWAPPAPPPYHRAPQNPPTTFLPYPGPPAPPVPGSQYTSPRVAPAQGVPGPYRELRPAPPQNRASLPPQPQPQASATRAWYPGYQ